MRRRDKYSVGAYTIHEETGARVHVVDVNVAVLGDQVEAVELGRRLHGDGKVVLSLGRKEDLDGLLGVGLVAGGGLTDLDYVQLAALGSAHGKAEQRAGLLVALEPELGEAGRVALDRLRDLALQRVELHAARHAILLRQNADEQQPLHRVVRSVVDDLTALQGGVTVEHLDRLRVALHAPVVDGQLGHDADRVHRDPLPEDAVLRHQVGLHLGLHFDVEDLKCFARFRTKNFFKFFNILKILLCFVLRCFVSTLKFIKFS